MRNTPIGLTNYRNQNKKFGIKQNDRFGHIYCIGKTGVGKSTLLLNMAIHDIQEGSGICVIDPHGDLATKILEYIPVERIKDVIYFDATDSDYVVPFNPLVHKGEDSNHLVTSGIVSAFKKIWVESWGPRLEHILRNSISTLLYYPKSSLLDIAPLLTNGVFRYTVLSHVYDKGLLDFWREEFDKYAPAFRNEAIAPILNKVGIFQSNHILRNIVGTSRSIDLANCMNTGKILIVNLSKGIIGDETCAVLGSLLLTQIQTHALSRAGIPEYERLPFHLYVDEAHTFITKTFADMLSEARKYKLSLFLTHQYTMQLTEDIRSAIFGNVGTFISFRVGHEDAEVVAKEFFPVFKEEDLINLPRYSCYLKLMIDGETSQPFSALTRALPPKQYVHKAQIVQKSQNCNALSRDVIEEEIAFAWKRRRILEGDQDQGNLFK